MSRWTLVPLARSLGSHAAAWDELNRSQFGSHPLLSSFFVEGLLHHFGKGEEHLCILQDGTAVRAMLILRPRPRFTWTSFTPAQGQISPTMVPEPDMLDTLVESLPGTVLQLDLLCNDPALSRLLRDSYPPPHRMAHALTMRIALDGTFSDYWAARPRNLPSNIRRYERRLQQDGLEPRMVCVKNAAEIAAAIERYTTLEGAGWKGRNGTALSSNREQFEFYRELMRGAAARGQAVVYELWVGDRLAASRLGLCEGGMLVMLKTSYDEDLARYAPGRLLLRAAIEEAFATHAGGTIEFYTDANADQLEWAGENRWIEHMTLYRNRLAAVAAQSLRSCRGSRRRVEQKGKSGDNRRAEWKVEAYAHPDALPADVRQFLERAEARNIGFGFAWYRNLVQTVYPGHDGLRWYALRRDGKVAAVLPLRAEPARMGWRLNSLSNFYTTLYEPVLAPGLKAASLLPLLAALRAEFRGLGSLMLTPMAPNSHAYLVLMEALGMDRWFPFEFFAFGNWYEPVRGTWQDYLAARKGNLRSTIKRMGKKFAAEGGVLEVVTSPEAVPKAIAAYEQVYAASWKKPEPFPGFMPGLLQACAEKGILRLGLAWLDGAPVAAQAWIVAHGRAEIYKVAYDEQFKAFAPGTLLTATLMQHVMEVDGVTEVDYLIGDDHYKRNWMSERRERWGIVAYNLRSLPGLAGFAREALGRIVKHVRSRLRRVPVVSPNHEQGAEVTALVGAKPPAPAA
jgi:CelD/BcsL family acetyltransferase involved in cellulose biosynthesis